MRFLVYIVPLVLLVYCWVEIAQSDPQQVRQLPRGLWAVVVLIPIAGPVAWLVSGRPNGEDVVHAPPRPRPRVVAPDDDPDFLRSLRRPPDERGSPPSDS
jgi:Phospholipase_D-nuclease N-terminal